jgi:CheY-like chemotaxis protein
MPAAQNLSSHEEAFLLEMEEPGQSADELRPGAGKCIAIAEDNAIQREGVGCILSQRGFDVVLLSNGLETLNFLRSGRKIDLLILDMMLPIRDGWSILAEKNRDPVLAAVPVIIMTALSIASREWAHSMGAVGLLRKPADEEVLLKEVQRLI